MEFHGKISKFRKMKQGVPQGGVLSPLVFNFYMTGQPTPPDRVRIVTYADDCTLLASNTNPQVASDLLNSYLPTLHNWLSERCLQLCWTKEVKKELEISINNQRIPTTQHPKVLGVTFNNLLTFNTNTRNINGKLRSRNAALKALAGSSCGKEKEILSTTYKAIGTTITSYATPVWSPQLSNTNWKLLQTSQNATLRTITGCHTMVSEDHLHQEALILPVKPHNIMMSKQYFLGSYLQEHPSNELLSLENPPRNIRKCTTTRNLMSLPSSVTKFMKTLSNEVNKTSTTSFAINRRSV